MSNLLLYTSLIALLFKSYKILIVLTLLFLVLTPLIFFFNHFYTDTWKL